MLNVKNYKLNINEELILKYKSIQLKKGMRLLLKGPSGSGKSSLIKSLYLNKYEYSENYNDLYSNCVYLPQFCAFYSDELNQILEDISEYSNSNFSLKKYKEISSPFSFLNKSFSKLSGGEKQTFQLLLAVSCDKEVLLLDESFSAMDETLRKKMTPLVENKTLVFIHHLENKKFLNPTDILDLSN